MAKVHWLWFCFCCSFGLSKDSAAGVLFALLFGWAMMKAGAEIGTALGGLSFKQRKGLGNIRTCARLSLWPSVWSSECS